MISIGKFSKICKVSTKALRYYDEIGLLKPSEINPENGYRYYSTVQLETMLFITRLKKYGFSLEEINTLIQSETHYDENLYLELNRKKKEIENKIQNYTRLAGQLESDLINLEEGKSMMSYLDKIDIQLVKVPAMYLISIRKMVQQDAFPSQYKQCFHELFKLIQSHQLKMIAPPMVLFHSDEFNPNGLDTEFAVPVEREVTRVRTFEPDLCLKTVLYGSYANLPSVYAKQCEWAEQNGYENNGALYEVYINDPSEVQEAEIITEIYYPVRKTFSND